MKFFAAALAVVSSGFGSVSVQAHGLDQRDHYIVFDHAVFDPVDLHFALGNLPPTGDSVQLDPTALSNKETPQVSMKGLALSAPPTRKIPDCPSFTRITGIPGFT